MVMLDVLMVGAGIGGLTAARSLARGGASVALVERAARPSAAGAGIVIKAMATSPLRATLFCHEDDVDALTRALHRAFRE